MSLRASGHFPKQRHRSLHRRSSNVKYHWNNVMLPAELIDNEELLYRDREIFPGTGHQHDEV
jgi:hypothetical protein